MRHQLMVIKTLFCLLIILFFWLVNGRAQNYYAGIDFGYGLGLASKTISDGSFHEIAPSVFRRTLVKHSYGQGANVNVHIGYKVNRFFSYEIMFSYLKGSKFKKEFVRGANINLDEGYSRMFRVAPNFKINLTKGKIDFYNRFGLVFGVFGNVIIERSSQTSLFDSYRKVKYKDGVSIGFITEPGIEFRLSNNLFLSTGLQIYVQSYAPKKSEIVEYSRNGEDMLESLSVSERYVEYVDEFIEDPNQNVDENRPSIGLKGLFPFSSVGLTLGVEYHFTKGK